MRDDERVETGPSIGIMSNEYHWRPPSGLRFWKGFAIGTARSSTGGLKAGPGGTNGTWTCVARSYNSQLNGLACPPKGMPRYSRLKTSSPSARRSCSRNSAENNVVSAVTFSRINDQFRVCFIWTEEGPKDVEITDYH